MLGDISPVVITPLLPVYQGYLDTVLRHYVSLLTVTEEGLSYPSRSVFDGYLPRINSGHLWSS